MSLIQEALEKAGRSPVAVIEEVHENKEIPIVAGWQKSKSTAEPSPYLSKIRIMITGILIFFSGFAIFQFVGSRLNLFPSGKVQMAVSSSLPQHSPISSLLNGPLSWRPSFVLTGVTSSGGEYMALINNQVVQIGDRLREDALVKTIGKEEVTLDFQGKEIKLSLNRP